MNILGAIILAALFLLAVFTLANWSVLTELPRCPSWHSLSKGRWA